MSDKPQQILLVDDEAMIVKVVSKRLQSVGYLVEVAMDGEEAIQKAKQLQPDLIILDLMLPKRNGYEVCEELKSDPQYKHIPILLFTALAQEKEIEKGNAAGCDGYVTKPFKSEILLEKIATLLAENPK